MNYLYITILLTCIPFLNAGADCGGCTDADLFKKYEEHFERGEKPLVEQLEGKWYEHSYISRSYIKTAYQRPYLERVNVYTYNWVNYNEFFQRTGEYPLKYEFVVASGSSFFGEEKELLIKRGKKPHKIVQFDNLSACFDFYFFGFTIPIEEYIEEFECRKVEQDKMLCKYIVYKSGQRNREVQQGNVIYKAWIKDRSKLE